MENRRCVVASWCSIKTVFRGVQKRRLMLSFTFFLAIMAGLVSHGEASNFTDALTKGKVSLNMRYRYEMVDQDGISKNAHASTLRSRLGYKTGDFLGVSAFLEFEDVLVVGGEQFRSSKSSVKTQFPIVADPEDTEVNQAYLQFSGIKGLMVRGGRQRIKLDNDRFIGNVGWRQNEQTFDALTLIFRPMKVMVATYVYIENVNRIFGAHHPVNTITKLSDHSAKIHTSSHAIHLLSTGLPMLNVSAYVYLLDFDNAPTVSNKTFGLRLKGAVSISSGFKIIYTAEFADQSDYADGVSTIDGDYSLFELGASAKAAAFKVSYEVLSGDGVYGFSTPLATVHAFQGWADKFLSTPLTGVEDLFFTLSGKAAGVKLVAVHHIFTSDSGGIDYGTETNLLAVKKLNAHYLLGIKYANYKSDSDIKNTGGTAVDTDKLWIFGQLKF